MHVDLELLLAAGAISGAEGDLGPRLDTIRAVAQLFAESPPRTMVETGCQSSLLLNAHGMSTTIWGAFARRYGAVLHSIDVDEGKIRQCRELAREYEDAIRYTVGDSIRFLSSFQRPIDFLYLDSLDFDCNDKEESRLHQLGEIRSAWDKLHPGSVVLLDDANVQRWFAWRLDDLDVQGKTAYAHRFLIEHGACCLADFPSYQRLYVIGRRTPV
jgi:hypothetical protein